MFLLVDHNNVQYTLRFHHGHKWLYHNPYSNCFVNGLSVGAPGLFEVV